jgi:hypothetical protein
LNSLSRALVSSNSLATCSSLSFPVHQGLGFRVENFGLTFSRLLLPLEDLGFRV